MIENWRVYKKAIVAFTAGVLQILALYITLNADNKFSPEDQNALIAAIVIAIGGTGAVYQIRNEEEEL